MTREDLPKLLWFHDWQVSESTVPPFVSKISFLNCINCQEVDFCYVLTCQSSLTHCFQMCIRRQVYSENQFSLKIFSLFQSIFLSYTILRFHLISVHSWIIKLQQTESNKLANQHRLNIKHDSRSNSLFKSTKVHYCQSLNQSCI